MLTGHPARRRMARGSSLICCHVSELSLVLSYLCFSQNYDSAEDLMQRKSKKRLILTGAARFNSKPKTGLIFLEENGLIYHDLSDEVTRPQSLAKFLKSSTRLDKKLLGDFISKPENIDVLKAFIGLFDFHEVRSLAAFILRMEHLMLTPYRNPSPMR